MIKIKKIVEDRDTAPGKIFDLSSQFLIVISLISFSIETLPDLSVKTRYVLHIIEVITVILFTVEYLLRIIVAEKKLKFIFSFFGIIDLLAILPFYVASGIDLRSIRIFRLLRLIRAMKILRYNNAIQRFKGAFLSVKEELILFFVATVFLLFVAGVGIYYFENPVQPEHFKSIFHCLWWAVVTLTTVGYGDSYPITAGGRIFTFFILMVGLGIIAIPTGLIASAFSSITQKKE
ncbi:MAG: ion transporter [Thermodesulfobacteriota bacterium]|nr:ion transporter [Thermodesulfobacteriota bacterium]